MLVLLCAACARNRIPLEYEYLSGAGTKYLWTIDSTMDIDSSVEHSSKRLRMSVDVQETLQRPRRRGEDAVLTISLTPRTLEGTGPGNALPPPTKVQYQLKPNGQIRKPVTTELPEREASALELGTLLAQSRLALPSRPVGIGDQWSTPLKLEGDTGTIDLKGRGRLVGFDLENGRKLARIETRRSGQISAQEQLGGTLVLLRGTSTSTSSSMLDVDRGVLYSSRSRLASDFDLSDHRSGRLAGTLRVVLVSTLELQPT